MKLTLPCSILILAANLFFAAPSHSAESADALIQQGNVYYDKLQPAEALKYYLPAEKLDPHNVDLLVRIARQYRHLMSDAADKVEKLHLGTTAVNYAERAVGLDPNSPDAQLSVAISYGKLLPLLSAKEQIADSRIMKTAVDKVLALDANNDLGWQILGRWYLGLAEVSPMKRALAQVVYGKLPPANFQDAERCFEKAIQINPTRLMHFIELGRTYADMGRSTDARRCLTKGLAMPNTEKDDPETKEKGRELLAKLR
jgi:tetratricopeptide (TPR) repeat protein